MKVTLRGKLLNPSEYLAAEEFGGKDWTLTIATIAMETLKRADGSEDVKGVMRFKETTKKLVLNKTNSQTIGKLHGPIADNWPGKRITVYPLKGRWFGEDGYAVRVREKIGKEPMPRKPESSSPSPEDEPPGAEVQVTEPTDVAPTEAEAPAVPPDLAKARIGCIQAIGKLSGVRLSGFLKSVTLKPLAWKEYVMEETDIDAIRNLTITAADFVGAGT